MNKFISLTVIFLFKFLTNVNSQSFCHNNVNTVDPTIFYWDWRTPFWDCKVSSNNGQGIITSIASPFNAIYSGDNINLSAIAGDADKDYEPSNGWELIRKQIGINHPSQPAVSNAYVIFYNKFTAKVRIFFLVTQNYSNTTVSEFNTGHL